MQNSENDAGGEATSRGPLSGLRILDLCSVVSGPMAAVVLADQGADVIKIEPPGWGDGIRNLGASRNGMSAIFALINRNKRSVGINLKHPSGANIVRRLAEDADVVMQNYRPGRMDRLDLGYEALSKINPELIYTSISGVGEVGPYAEQRVFDYVIQGLSGVVDAQSTDGEPKMVRTILYDKLTALTAAQGITAALLARERGAGGTHVQLSMLDAGIYFNWPELMWNCSFEGEGVNYSGELADMYEVSKTSDGHIVSHHLGADTSGYTTDELVELLAANEIAVARVNSREDVLRDPQVEAMKLLHRFEHPRGGAMVLPRSPLRFGDQAWTQQRPSPDVGQHTVEVLAELGMTMDEMQALAREQAIG
ncbi:MAG: CoA transferase [Pseudomonadales bacterium]|nr:CoA transferase [Pseudomonadales bacterium]